MDEIRTARLLLRRWRDEDRAAFAALNADPVVMQHFPTPLTRAESDRLVDSIESAFAQHGYGLWAVQADGGFLGFTGLAWQELANGPALEVGWRLARAAWGRGYATEAATAALDHGLQQVERVVSMTALQNLRSQRVMQRIGLSRLGEFEHPRLPAGHRLRRHVLYAADQATWIAPRDNSAGKQCRI